MEKSGLAVIPLIKKLAGEAKQVWFANDATGGGNLQQLRWRWDKLNKVGPAFGYFPNTAKTWLVVKESQLASTQELFKDSGINGLFQVAHPPEALLLPKLANSPLAPTK